MTGERKLDFIGYLLAASVAAGGGAILAGHVVVGVVILAVAGWLVVRAARLMRGGR